MTDWIFELSFAEVCLHKKDKFIYICFVFACLYICKIFFRVWCSYIGRCFRAFQVLLKTHAHYRVSTSVCHLWGPEKRVSCHPLTGLIWARMWGGGGGFLNPKNLKFERFHILKNSWKWRIEFLNFPLLKSVSTRKTFLFTYVLFLLVFTFVNLFPFLMFLFRTMFSSFPNSIENHAHCTFTPSVCKDQKNVYHVIHWPGSFGPGREGFVNPKNLKFERFHVLKK